MCGAGGGMGPMMVFVAVWWRRGRHLSHVVEAGLSPIVAVVN